MAPPISYAKLDLSIPLQCVEFDPYSRGYVVVAGGGGENKAGVPNKIVVLDSHNLAVVEQVAEAVLPSTEDTVTSLSSLATKDGLLLYAGINSSSKERQAGKNEHFRSFEVKLPARPKDVQEKLPQGSIAKINQTGLFTNENVTGKNKYAYQASTRLSPAQTRDKPSKRLGAIVSGLAEFGEIVTFDATIASPSKSAVCSRLNLGKDVEVLDLDIQEPYEGIFALAYCTDSAIYTYELSYDFTKRKVTKESKPSLVYNIPKKVTGTGVPSAPKLRWLGSHNLLLVRNVNGGTELLVLHLSKEGEPGQIVARKRLPPACTAAKAADVRLFDADPGSGERQAAIAVASDQSIYIYTTNLRPSFVDPLKQITPLKKFSTIDNAHAANITRIAFSNFFAPRQPADSPKSVATPAQYVQLASVSLSGTVSVETLALTSTPTSPSRTPQVAANPHPNVRWVLSTASSELITSWSARVLIAFVVVITGVLLRSYLDAVHGENAIADTVNNLASLVGHGPLIHPKHAPSVDIPGAPGLDTAGISDSMKEAVVAAQEVADPAGAKRHHLRDLLYNKAQRKVSQQQTETEAEHAEQEAHAILVHLDDETDDAVNLGATTHEHANTDALIEKGAVRYEDMHESDRAKWRKRLEKAGHWTESQGEKILLSVLFSEYAGIVGGAIRDAVLN